MPRANQNAQVVVAELSEPVLASMAEWLLRNEAFVQAVAEKTDNSKGVALHHKFPAYAFLQALRGSGFMNEAHYKYGHKRTDGRKYVSGYGLQRLQRTLRHLQTRGIMRDWDIVNAFMTLLLRWCEENLTAAGAPPYAKVREFVENRAAIFERHIGVTPDLRGPPGTTLTRDTMKTAVTALPMGGGKMLQRGGDRVLRTFAPAPRPTPATAGREYRSECLYPCKPTVPLADFTDPFLLELYDELQGVLEAVAQSEAGRKIMRSFKTDEFNPHGKVISRVLGVMEGKALDAMFECARSLDVTVYVLIFDGFMSGRAVPEGFEAQLEAAVLAATGWHVRIMEKDIPEVDVRAVAAELGVELHDMNVHALAVAEQAALLAGTAQLADPPVRPIGAVDIPAEGIGEAVLEVHPERGVVLRNGLFCGHEEKFLSCNAGMVLGKSHQMVYFVADYISGGKPEELLAAMAAAAARGESEESVTVAAARARGARVAVWTQRCTMVNEHMKRLARFGFRRYDTSANQQGTGPGAISLNEWPLVVVELESIHRVVGVPGVTILDEARSMLRCYVSPTHGEEGTLIASHWEQLCTQIASPQCKKVLLLDADLDMDGGAAALLEGWRARCRAAGSPDGAKAFNVRYLKMRRQVLVTTKKNAQHRALSAAKDGKRTAMVYGRKNQAKQMAALLRQHGVSVGLYTGDNKVRGDVEELWRDHQVIIFTSVFTTGADYQGEVEEVYVMAATNCQTVADFMQGSGRLRNVASNLIVVGVSPGAQGALPLVREELDQHQVLAQAALAAKRAHMGQVMDQGRRVVLTLAQPEAMAGLQLTMADDNLATAYSYSEAERVYTRSEKTWLRFWLYMCECKGYPVLFDWQETKEAEETSKQMTKLSAQLAEAQWDTLDTLPVGMLVGGDERSLADFSLLGRIVKGMAVKPEQELQFREKYSGVLGLEGQPVEQRRERLRLAYDKARACRLLRREDGELQGKFVNRAINYEHVLEVRDVMSRMPELGVAAAMESVVRAGNAVPAEGTPAALLLCAQLCRQLLTALGLPHPVRDAQHVDMATIDNSQAVTQVLHDATQLGVGSWSAVGLSNTQRAARMLETHIGLELNVLTGAITVPKALMELEGLYQQPTAQQFLRRNHCDGNVRDLQPCEDRPMAENEALRGAFERAHVMAPHIGYGAVAEQAAAAVQAARAAQAEAEARAQAAEARAELAEAEAQQAARAARTEQAEEFAHACFRTMQQQHLAEAEATQVARAARTDQVEELAHTFFLTMRQQLAEAEAQEAETQEAAGAEAAGAEAAGAEEELADAAYRAMLEPSTKRPRAEG